MINYSSILRTKTYKKWHSKPGILIQFYSLCSFKKCSNLPSVDEYDLGTYLGSKERLDSYYRSDRKDEI